MKRRHIKPEIDSERAERSLCEALLALRSVEEMKAFIDDLCTPAEREAMRDRWSVVPHLIAGEPYWQIHDATAVSITTIGRVARCLEQGSGGYANAARRARVVRVHVEKPRQVGKPGAVKTQSGLRAPARSAALLPTGKRIASARGGR